MNLTRRDLIELGLGAVAGVGINEFLHYHYPKLFLNFRGEKVPEWDKLAALNHVDYYINLPELHKRSDAYSSESLSVLEMVLGSERKSMKGRGTIDSIIHDNLVKFYRIEADGEREVKMQGGCGFLITTDGFIVTTYHTVKKLLEKLQGSNNDNSNNDNAGIRYTIRDLRGNEYTVDENFVAFNKYLDIAIVRALIPRSPEPIPIPCVDGALQEGDGVTLYAFHNGLVFSKAGKIVKSTTNIRVNGDLVFDSFVTDIEAGGGSSGAVLVQDGKFAGTVIYESLYPVWWGRDKRYTGGAKSGNIAYLARKSTERLRIEINL